MSTFTETVVDGLPFGDSVAATVQKLSLTGPFDRLDIGEQVIYEFIPAKNRLSVSDSVTVAGVVQPSRLHPREDDATVTDVIAVNLTLTRALTDTLTIQDFVSYFLASPDWVNPVVTVPTNNTMLTLVSTSSGTLDLRKPDFGDSDSYEPFRVSRESRGGDIQIYQDTIWPKTEILSFKFSYLDPTVADDFIAFLKATAGEKLTLHDHFGRTWQGWILTPAGDVVQEKRTTKTAAFKFQVAPS